MFYGLFAFDCTDRAQKHQQKHRAVIRGVKYWNSCHKLSYFLPNSDLRVQPCALSWKHALASRSRSAVAKMFVQFQYMAINESIKRPGIGWYFDYHGAGGGSRLGLGPIKHGRTKPDITHPPIRTGRHRTSELVGEDGSLFWNCSMES